MINFDSDQAARVYAAQTIALADEAWDDEAWDDFDNQEPEPEDDGEFFYADDEPDYESMYESRTGRYAI